MVNGRGRAVWRSIEEAVWRSIEGSTVVRSQKYVSAAFDTLDLTILLLRLENLTGMKGIFIFLRFICVSTSFWFVFKSETIAMDESWLKWNINLTLQIPSTLTNLQSALTWIPQLVTVKLKQLSFTKTHITSLQKISLLSNNCQKYLSLTQICSSR